VQLLSGPDDAQERLRFRDHRSRRGGVDQAGHEAGRRQALRLDQGLEDLTPGLINVLLGGVFHASILFLVAAGLQVVFGVQKIFNLACGSFYALGAYVGVSAVAAYTSAGGPPWLFIVPLAVAGLLVGLVGVVVERGLLRFVYDRDETFQLLLTFALVLMLEDVIRLTWGTSPRSTGGLYLIYGQVRVLGATLPVYNLIVVAASLAIALGIGGLLSRTAFGRIVRAAADNREMAEALGVDMRRVDVRVFTLGAALGTLGGALVIPSTAAMSEMGIELIVEAFAVVVIGGLGSMRGAFVGALVVGILRAVAISLLPAVEMLLIYLIVIGVLVLRPRGLFGAAPA
jgi:branched-chain amino acid transport system permease protein